MTNQTATKTTVVTPTPNLITISIIGANLMAVAPLAFTIWMYSQFLPASVTRINQ